MDGEPANLEQKFTIVGMGADDTHRLNNRLEIAIGMKTMVTLNIATEADLANGSRGVIDSITLDPREPEVAHVNGVVWLRYPPAMIVFKPNHFEFDKFPGFDDGLIPIFPTQRTFNITYKGVTNTKVTRRQFSVDAAYAFTIHKGQGQTVPYVIVDIGATKRFPVDAFAAYVALSRSRGRETIRLLRDFDNKIFTQHPSEELRIEDERLKMLQEETKKRFDSGYYTY